MATTRSARTVWKGDLFSGNGQTSLETSGLGTYDVTWKARAEDAKDKTSPEELIAAAHSACYSMAFSNILKEAGHTAESIETSAEVDFDTSTGAQISEIRLFVNATVPGISDEDFQKSAQAAKEGCPVSKALASVPSITLDAKLNS
ncbi:OsmC family protein [Arthrobacter crystallopoietes BAB-32]|uniref:OsmC family protein n=1 Tax=Arthrobacter crystallopoietes BAB-32 TaxID=1246476 RepID=N1UYU5_9MICC|nr:OsmC family protein [Arthrobacter crystallopoietes]EMY33007.1 OsmC family protein [Arthrobacter crystallopoietes BAB-32]